MSGISQSYCARVRRRQTLAVAWRQGCCISYRYDSLITMLFTVHANFFYQYKSRPLLLNLCMTEKNMVDHKLPCTQLSSFFSPFCLNCLSLSYFVFVFTLFSGSSLDSPKYEGYIHEVYMSYQLYFIHRYISLIRVLRLLTIIRGNSRVKKGETEN